MKQEQTQGNNSPVQKGLLNIHGDKANFWIGFTFGALTTIGIVVILITN